MENSSDIKEQLIKNGGWGIVSSFLNRIGGFILTILISRMLMPEDFGRYSIIMTVVLFFITLFELGINQTLIRYISLEINKNKEKATAHFKYLFKVKFILSSCASLILLISSYILSSYLFKDKNLFIPLAILSFYLFFISLTLFFESLFYVKKNVKYISIKELFSIIFRIAFILVIGFFIGSDVKVIWICISLVFFSLFSFIYVFFISKKKYPSLFKPGNYFFNKKHILKFMFFLNLQNVSLLVLSNITLILLGTFLNSEFVGYYNLAWALIVGIISLLFSFSPIFLAAFTKSDENSFQLILKKIFKMFLLLALPIAFGLSFFSKFFILELYGENYLLASIPLSILAFSIPFIFGVNLSLDCFFAKNKQRNFSRVLVFFSIISAVLNYFIIKLSSSDSPEHTLIIVSIINLTIWISCFLSALYLLKKELKTQIIAPWILKSLFSCGIMYFVLWISLKIIKDLTLIKGVLLIIFGASIYIISLFLIGGIKKEEIRWIYSLVKNKK